MSENKSTQRQTLIYDINQIENEINREKKEVLKKNNAGDYYKRRNLKAIKTPTEKRMAKIWGEMFDTDEIGADSDFFSLGGDSVMAVQLMSRIAHEFKIEIPGLDFFNEELTIENLSKMIDENIINQAGNDKINEALNLINSMSDEEVKAMLKTNAED